MHGERVDVDAVSDAREKLWASLPGAVLHPMRVPIVEAMWWLGQPLTALALVSVLDGALTVWEVAYHLEVLEELEAAESLPAATGNTRQDASLLVPYRLKGQASGDGE